MSKRPPPKEDKIIKNNLTQVFQKMMKSKTPDVLFIVKGKSNEKAVKVPAHKDVLAAMSPVFDAMFNGELKEKGDVKIVDASAAAFEEFLQFFYKDQVKLTMENIDDVLNLANKYDVSDYFQMAIEFLKEHLNNGNLIWGLQLAVKYQSDDLKQFCRQTIENDPKALDVFITDDSNAPPHAKKRRLLSTNPHYTCTLAEALSIAKEVILKQSAEIERLRMKNIFQFIVSKNTVYTESQICSVEQIAFNPKRYNSSLWLREIRFAKVFTKCRSSYRADQLKGTVLIGKGLSNPTTIFEKQFGMNSDEESIKLSEPINFDGSSYYTITIKPSVRGFPSAIEEKNDVNVAFKDKLSMYGSPIYSLIDRLYFEELPKNGNPN